ncbi:MAG: hypothetical protein ACFFC7_04050 [Candidatus Hermodarchaeota archaeon]
MVNSEKILAETMDKLPELEGIILNQGSKIVAAKTIFEDINDQEAAQQAIQAASAAAMLSQTLGKGALDEISIIFEEGLAIIMGQGDFVLTAIGGVDARTSLGVLKLNLRRCLTRLLE